MLAGQPAFVGDVLAERRVFDVTGAAAHTDFDPTAAERVDDGDVLGESDRVFEGQDRDGGSEPDPGRPRGGVCEEGPRRGEAATAERHVMLGDPADVEAELIRNDEELLSVVVRLAQVVTSALDMGEETEPEARCLGGHE